MKSRLPILLPLSLLILASLACGSAPNAPAAAPGAGPSPTFTPDTTMACVMSHTFMERYLKAPGTAKWGPCNEAVITVKPDGSYFVKSYVDSQNSFGAMLRLTYSALLQQVDADNWRLINLMSVDSNGELSVLYQSMTPTPGGASATPAPAASSPGKATPPAGATVKAPAGQTVTAPATPRPAAAKDANLRAGPATTFKVVGSVKAGAPLGIVGKNKAGDWYKLAGGEWIAAFLVANPPTVPVVE